MDEKVNSCFKIKSISTPNKGTASITGETTLQWKIDELGVKGSEGATLEFTVEHIGQCTGKVAVNDEIKYKDKEGNSVKFLSPEIEVDCGIVVISEECPKPMDVHLDGCEDTVEIDADDVRMESLGRVIQLDVTIKNVCPYKRVALAAMLTEVDEHGLEHKRGLKTLAVPAHDKTDCHDVMVRCIKFVVPENLEVLKTATDSGICKKRHFKVRWIAHYIDSGFECCNVVD